MRCAKISRKYSMYVNARRGFRNRGWGRFKKRQKKMRFQQGLVVIQLDGMVKASDPLRPNSSLVQRGHPHSRYCQNPAFIELGLHYQNEYGYNTRM